MGKRRVLPLLDLASVQLPIPDPFRFLDRGNQGIGRIGEFEVENGNGRSGNHDLSISQLSHFPIPLMRLTKLLEALEVARTLARSGPMRDDNADQEQQMETAGYRNLDW
jgi:hypothetical protein